MRGVHRPPRCVWVWVAVNSLRSSNAFVGLYTPMWVRGEMQSASVERPFNQSEYQ